MFTLIKPGTKIDFMGRRKLFFAISGALVTASIVAVLVLGLNRGIDFKGGTKLIVSFDIDSEVSRTDIKATIEGMVHKETGEKGTQVEVQDFDIAQGGEVEKHKFQIYTELTSLLNDTKRSEIDTAVKEKFAAQKPLIESPDGGGDVFYITFSEPAASADRERVLKALFVETLAFEDVDVQSDSRQAMGADYVRRRNLFRGDAKEEARMAELAAEKEAEIETSVDKRFTVKVGEIKAKMEEALKGLPGNAEVESSTSVSASVGADLLADGLLAILYAIIGMLLYITLRFDLRYAPGAVVALIHDVTITIGVFALLQVKFTLPIIAALLTIVGYSLNDTIVVFDRIRENVEKLRGRVFEQVINTSINETLSRTLLTSITTLLVVGSILVLGGGLIKDFAFALTIGIFVGTYSSVFIASPVALFVDGLLAARSGSRKAAR